jgi:amidase
VTEAVPPRIEEAWDITMMYWARVESHSWREWQTTREHTLTADQIERGMFAWGRLRREMLTFIQDYDVVLCPVAPAPAPPREERSYVPEFIYTLPYSLTGWPVAVVRAATSPEGLPIGVQLAAAPWRDDVALAAARVVEEALGGWQPPPE